MIGLYLGPVVLGSLVADGIYRSVCGGQRFALGGVFSSHLFQVLFGLMAAALAWSMRELRARLAFGILTFQQAVVASGWMFGAPVDPLLIGSLSVAFAVLVTMSGASMQPKWRLIVPAVFAAMFVVRWLTIYYADGIMGRHSVFRPGPFC